MIRLKEGVFVRAEDVMAVIAKGADSSLLPRVVVKTVYGEHVVSCVDLDEAEVYATNLARMVAGDIEDVETTKEIPAQPRPQAKSAMPES